MIKPRNHLNNFIRIPADEPSRMFWHRLDRNERNQAFSDSFVNKIKDRINGELFMVYPELDPVYNKVANWLGVKPTEILLHSGSDQAIKAVFETYINPGDSLLLHFPSYAMYEIYGKMFQANVISCYYDSNLSIDWYDFVSKINPKLRMVVVENPNGFLGSAPPIHHLEAIIERSFNTGTLVLVDEAYFHFNDQTVQNYIERYDNLIISRTFSKAFGLAGMRVGYLISRTENIANLKKVRPVYEINSIAAMVVEESLNNLEELECYINDNRNNLKQLREGLAELGIASSDSMANFVAARLGEYSIHEQLREILRNYRILIRRPFREEHLKEWVRISTSPPDIQSILLGEIKRIITAY